MTILADDIKLIKSRVMDDVPEGGGAPTANVITDGASNAIFNDISELDRAGGDVSFRKMFIHVQTDNTDTYLGSNVIVAAPPEDPNVSVTLFTTGEVFDERSAAASRVESYLVPSSEWAGCLLENHVTGQRSITIFQRPEEATPNIGQTLIVVYKEGETGERLQYVRVISVSSVVRTYTDSEGKPFQGAAVTCELSDPLRFDFPGSAPSKTFSRESTKSKIRASTVGDAAVYAGVSPTTAIINIGDVAANIESVFTQLVPSAQTETPLIDQNAAGQTAAVTAAGDGTISYTTSQPFNSTTVLSVGNSIVPESLSITVGSSTITDEGGQVFDGGTVVGTVDYALGLVAFPSLVTPYNGTKTVTFAPATAPARVADTYHIPVTQETRSFNYILTILPLPMPGTVSVSYRSQGRWYDLRDNGSGVMAGVDSSYGAGSVSYISGTVSVTLGALPDDGSAILFSWGNRVNLINRADMPVDSPTVSMQLGAGDVAPNTVSITWNDGSARTATDDGKGEIEGDATGTIDYETGLVTITPTTLPAGGQTYSVEYSVADEADVLEHEEVAPAREGDGTIIFELGGTNITPGTVKLSWPAEMTSSFHLAYAAISPTVKAKDDGNGNIVVETGRVAGTINYTTGTITFQPDGNVTGRIQQWNTWVGGGTLVGYTYAGIPTVMPPTGTIVCKFQANGTPDAMPAEEFTASAGLKIDLTTRYQEQITPGSVNFLLGGRRYFDRAGSLYNQIEVSTGAATLAGTINYTTGEVTLSNWVPGASSTVDLDALVTMTGDQSVSNASFRIPVSPVRTGSVQILATKAAGGTINVTADLDGDIADTGVFGTVDYETGVVLLRFGTMVTAAGNEDEPWYDEDLVEGGQIFRPEPVFASTLRFNAVAFSYLPLDAAILGLDPVRLPQDGRVPIFRRGGFGVIGHSATTSPATVSNAQTIDCGRVRLSRVRVIGDDGNTITSGYTADLEAGTVTFNDVSGYSQPVSIEHRIEDMVQISDVQISGRLAFTRQVTHQYPVGSYISTALIANDLKARVSHFFDQATWNGTTWEDAVSGDAATGTYNNTLSPIVVTNRGAVTERWALRFTSNTAFQVIGEHVGIVDVGTINADCSPINPATGTPYFTILEDGWGSGWAIGNIVRLNTVGAQFPVWAVRTVQQGAETVQDDSFTILVRGDVDRP